MIKSICLSVLLVFLIGACVTIGNEKISKPELVSQIQIGKSTKEDVRILVGEPTKVNFQENGKEIWEYTYSKTTVKPTTFIPYVGLLAGGTDTSGNTLTIMFNSNGVVEKFGSGKITGESRT